jgi:FO synthase subunit 1
VFAGINDLGGVSPITIDYVNPECPWPQIGIMGELSSDLGFSLKERLPVYPEFISDEFIDKNLLDRLNKFIDNRGYVVPKEDNDAIN